MKCFDFIKIKYIYEMLHWVTLDRTDITDKHYGRVYMSYTETLFNADWESDKEYLTKI